MKIKGISPLIAIFLIISMLLLGCGASKSGGISTATQTGSVKTGVIAFVKNILNKEGKVPEYVEQYIRDANHYLLSVNASGNSIFFTLTANISDNVPPASVEDTHIRISIGDGKLEIEGFIPSASFQDTASVVFSGNMAWVKKLIYDKIRVFTVGTELPYGAKEFILYTLEENPWNAYISLKYMGLTDGEPQKVENGGAYLLELKDGHTVFIIETNQGVAIYK